MWTAAGLLIVLGAALFARLYLLYFFTKKRKERYDEQLKKVDRQLAGVLERSRFRHIVVNDLLKGGRKK